MPCYTAAATKRVRHSRFVPFRISTHPDPRPQQRDNAHAAIREHHGGNGRLLADKSTLREREKRRESDATRLLDYRLSHGALLT